MLAPQTEAEVAEIVAGAQDPLAVQGGGTRGLGARSAGTAMSLSGLTGITLYEPGALTVVAQAGTPLAEIEATLAAEGQRLPFEPMDHRALLASQGEPTIGGVVAGNVSGPRRIQAGACRDSLIGVRFVDGMGQVIKNGGRVMKNVTGYDLVKLMAGSHGTLGVLTEVSFKVLPVPEAVAVLGLAGLGDARAVEALSRALGSPYEVTGAAHLRHGPDGRPVTLIRLEGFAEQVRYRAAQLTALLSDLGDITLETDPGQASATWRMVRDAAPFAGEPGDVWRLSVKPSDGPALGAALDQRGALDLFYDWGGGLVWARMAPGASARAAMDGIDGHATLVRAAPATHTDLGTFHPQAAPLAALSQGLRARFDPRGILNPGLMG